ncbi:MAG: hypothetical protein QXI10_01125 [Candidatus Diapherotrites archaeon]
MNKTLNLFAIILIIIIISTAHATEVFWLRGSDEMIDIKGKKEYSLLEIKPNQHSTETQITFIGNDKKESKLSQIASFYRAPLQKDITIYGPATLWISDMKTEGKPKIRFSLIDVNSETNEEIVIAQSEWKNTENYLQFESIVDFEPYVLNGNNILKLALETETEKEDKISFTIDKPGKENITWITQDGTELKIEGIESTGALLINAEGLPEIKCKSSFDCSDGNVMTIDICYLAGTYNAYCGNEIGECKIGCYSNQDCMDFPDGFCESPGNCNSKCIYKNQKESISVKILQPDKPEYKKGSFVRVSAKISGLNNEKIFGANMTAETDTGIIVPMREIEQGIFEGFFQIPNRTNTGNMRITFKATKDNNFGSEKITIKTISPKITIYLETKRKRDMGNTTIIISKAKDTFEIGEKIELTTKAFYENGEPVITDSVYATIDDQIIKLYPKERGVYSGEHTIYNTEKTELEVKINLDDGYNNLAEYKDTIKITKGSFIAFLAENATIILLAILLLSVLLIVISKGLNKVKEISLLIKKEKDITEQIKELQTKYYLKRSIDKKTYEREMKKLEPILKEIREKRNEIKKSLKIT